MRFWEDGEGDTDISFVVSFLPVPKVGVSERGDLELEERVTRLVHCRAISSVAFRLVILEVEACPSGFPEVRVVCTADGIAVGDSNAYFSSVPLKVD